MKRLAFVQTNESAGMVSFPLQSPQAEHTKHQSVGAIDTTSIGDGWRMPGKPAADPHAILSGSGERSGCMCGGVRTKAAGDEGCTEGVTMRRLSKCWRRLATPLHLRPRASPEMYDQARRNFSIKRLGADRVKLVMSGSASTVRQARCLSAWTYWRHRHLRRW